jgi:hypothetical protein
MSKVENPYWSARRVLDWTSQAGIEEEATLMQLPGAIFERKLKAVGRKCEWSDDVVVSSGKMETIPHWEALDLIPMLGPDKILHLFVERPEYPLYDDDRIIYFDNSPGLITNQKPELYRSWSNVFFDSSDVRNFWPGNGEPSELRSTLNAERRCQEWLEQLMLKGGPAKAKIEYRTEAIATFSISVRAFERAWRTAIANIGAVRWSKPGRKS